MCVCPVTCPPGLVGRPCYSIIFTCFLSSLAILITGTLLDCIFINHSSHTSSFHNNNTFLYLPLSPITISPPPPHLSCLKLSLWEKVSKSFRLLKVSDFCGTTRLLTFYVSFSLVFVVKQASHTTLTTTVRYLGKKKIPSFHKNPLYISH